MSAMLEEGAAFHYLVSTLPRMQFSTELHHWRQFIRLSAASSGATKCFVFLTYAVVLLPKTCKHPLMCKVAELLFNSIDMLSCVCQFCTDIMPHFLYWIITVKNVHWSHQHDCDHIKNIFLAWFKWNPLSWLKGKLYFYSIWRTKCWLMSSE